MPWFAVPFDAPDMTQRLVTNLLDTERNGIPHLAVIRPDGTPLEVDDVVRQIEADPQGLQFPWPAPPLSHYLPEQFCRYSQTEIDDCLQFESMSKLKNKYLLLYFAGQWNSTCRNYGPQLNEAYKNLKLHYGGDFELLLVSSDRCNADFEQHLSELSFGAIPYEEVACREGLTRRLKIRNVPALVMLGPNEREVINDKVHLMGDCIHDFPYHPKQCGDFQCFPMEINLHKCVLIFCEESDDEVQAGIVRACQEASEELLRLSSSSSAASAGASGGVGSGDTVELVKIFWNLKPNAVSESVRSAIHLPLDGRLHMIMLDLPDDCAYYVATSTTTGKSSSLSQPLPKVVCDEITADDIVRFCKNPGVRRKLV
ncbi:hypothetical protein MHU86_6187 [Fragilaria crotonensis]|nr:hypothetical protein MHU86_6187 [Fragilaria crotonensis]